MDVVEQLKIRVSIIGRVKRLDAATSWVGRNQPCNIGLAPSAGRRRSATGASYTLASLGAFMAGEEGK